MDGTVVAWEQKPPSGERKKDGFMLADLVLAISLALLLGNAIVSIIGYLNGSGDELGEVSTTLLWGIVVTNALIFVLLPMLWTILTIEGGWDGVRRYLGMTGGWNELFVGAGVGVAMVIGIGGIVFLLDQIGISPESAPIEDLLKNVTWPLAIAFSAVAGFGEEVLFRGILQKWLRWWGQGFVFGALHIANAGLFAFAATALIGLGFGYARHRGVSLWLLIAAHFVYDIILMAVAIAFPELAESGGNALL